jgi:hypothetical protein
MSTFSLRLPNVGVAQRPGLVRGYVRPGQCGKVVMHVAIPPGGRMAPLRTYADGRLVSHSVRGGLVSFSLPTAARRAANWAVVG